MKDSRTDPFDWDAPEERAAPAAPVALSVAQVCAKASTALKELGVVVVEGELSRITDHQASGHMYFDLKDSSARVSCSLFRQSRGLALRGLALREGLQVRITGKLEIYGPQGKFSLVVTRVEAAGLGALMQEYERLKQELLQKGWFERKRPLPKAPCVVGVVTSRGGAALQDFLRTRAQRWSGHPLVVAHAAVQGRGAAEEVARGIRALDEHGVDVVVVCRGGGSVEDLWAFNELPLLEAVWNCSKPVVSGVGHEIDTTLCDLVADLRAHTPTDAAEKVFPDRAALLERIESADGDLGRAMDLLLDEAEARLAQLASRPCLSSPRWFLDERAARLHRATNALVERMQGLLLRAEARLEAAGRRVERRSPRVELEQRAARLELCAARLSAAPLARLERAGGRLETAARTLEAVSPLAVLGRGYSITFVEGATKPLVDASDAAPGATLVTRLADGELRSRVEGGS